VSDLRILCLHGYHGNAEILRRQMAPLASSIAGVDFVYVDAPSLGSGGDFGWWHSPAVGWDRTRQWALDFFATQPRFDGVFGFSQGAAFAGLLVGMQQEPRATIRFDFAVMVGGFKNDAPQHANLYRRSFVVPSLHIIGHTDGVIPPNESEELAHQFENPVVLYHAGGHVVPADRAVVSGVAKFFESVSEHAPATNAARDAR
jgi:pimeloyl-ACP methyl ester carboxylesterase